MGALQLLSGSYLSYTCGGGQCMLAGVAGPEAMMIVLLVQHEREMSSWICLGIKR
jgi:hypothetical protein